MKNLKPLRRDAKTDLLKIISQKRTSQKKEILEDKIRFIKGEYSKYKRIVEGKRIGPLSVTTEEGASYKSLYDSKTKVSEEIRSQIVESVPKIFSGKCVNCFIGNNEELDHFLPQSHFPYLSIFHLNLVPICGVCNKNKGENIPRKKKDYLHPYFDKMPNTEYLKCRLIINENYAKADYYLYDKNIQKIADRVKEHYKNLKLFDRFRENAAFYLARISHVNKKRGPTVARKNLESDLDILKLCFGKNHWNVVLCKEMIKVGYLC
ncbi:hypothetical protein [Leptospira yasudae]|uniref:HNH endonuclease n=1 Tax=Leptospira yasudae TaxID=2202201 RepID=A0ABX9LXB6_9LEPT|nr:hypothetical protein [Leptospira yasudae]RHX77492.1 hypothetical protein DLM77_20950 [Leptospira yasudae]